MGYGKEKGSSQVTEQASHGYCSVLQQKWLITVLRKVFGREEEQDGGSTDYESRVAKTPKHHLPP